MTSCSMSPMPAITASKFLRATANWCACGGRRARNPASCATPMIWPSGSTASCTWSSLATIACRSSPPRACRSAAGGMLVVLVTSSHWWAPLGYTVGSLLLLGLGGLGVRAAGDGLTEGFQLIRSLEPTQPWWLLFLCLLPVIVLLSYRSLAGLGPVRR